MKSDQILKVDSGIGLRKLDFEASNIFLSNYIFRFNKPNPDLELEREEEKRFQGLNSLQPSSAQLNFPPLGLKLFGIDSADGFPGSEVQDEVFSNPGEGFNSGFENSHPPFLFEPVEEGYSGIYGFSTPRPYLAPTPSPHRYTPVTNPGIPPIPTHPSKPHPIFSKSQTASHLDSHPINYLDSHPINHLDSHPGTYSDSYHSKYSETYPKTYSKPNPNPYSYSENKHSSYSHPTSQPYSAHHSSFSYSDTSHSGAPIESTYPENHPSSTYHAGGLGARKGSYPSYPHSITPKPYISSLPQSYSPSSSSSYLSSPSYSSSSSSDYPNHKSSYDAALLSPTYVSHREDRYFIQH